MEQKDSFTAATDRGCSFTQREAPAALIRSGDLLRVVDNQNLQRSLLGFQFQPQLLLQRPLPGDKSVAVRFRFNFHADVVDAFDPGLVEHWN